jgi:phosphate transport system permease protein
MCQLAAGLATVAVVVGLGAILFDVVVDGASGVDWEFLASAPLDAGRQGGIASILVATIWTAAVCLTVAIPTGFCAAAWLAERTDAECRLVQRALDVLAATPSIVFGLFGSVFFCEWLGLGFSILSGGLTLACMILPIVIRTTETGLRAVPSELCYAAAAVGLGPFTTLVRVLVPAAAPALVAGVVLGLGRALSETAALIFTSGYVDRMPESLLDSGRVLSVHIYDLSMNVPGGEVNACRSAFVLVFALIVIESGAWLMLRRIVSGGKA